MIVGSYNLPGGGLWTFLVADRAHCHWQRAAAACLQQHRGRRGERQGQRHKTLGHVHIAAHVRLTFWRTSSGPQLRSS